MTNDNARENTIRVGLKRLGLELVKSSAKMWSENDYQGYKVIDPQFNLVATGERFDMTLADLEKFVEDTEFDNKHDKKAGRIRRLRIGAVKPLVGTPGGSTEVGKIPV